MSLHYDAIVVGARCAGAPVSMPLEWPQVKRGLDPARFTVRTAPALIAKSRAWADYCKSERPLPREFLRK